MSSTLLYIDIAAVTALFSTDLIDISHAEDGEPGTGTIRGIFPEGAFWQDSIDLLTISVESGLAFDAALAQVARNSDGPLSDEFTRVLQEIQIGSGRKNRCKMHSAV